MTRIRQREDTATAWTAANPILLAGEIGWESGAVIKAKKGDGVTAWNALPYIFEPSAPLNSPAFTGNPTAPTPATADNDTSLATTAFVKAALAALIAGSPALLDTLDELAAALGDDPNFAATITAALGAKAPLASPILTGNPTAPTPAVGDNDTSVANTAFVQSAMANSYQVRLVPTGSGPTTSGAYVTLVWALPFNPRLVVITPNNSGLYAACDYGNSSSTSLRIYFRSLTSAGAPGLVSTDPGAYAVAAYA